VGCVLAAIGFRFLRYLNTDKTHRPRRFYLRHFRYVTAIDSVSFLVKFFVAATHPTTSIEATIKRSIRQDGMR